MLHRVIQGGGVQLDTSLPPNQRDPYTLAADLFQFPESEPQFIEPLPYDLTDLEVQQMSMAVDHDINLNDFQQPAQQQQTDVAETGTPQQPPATAQPTPSAPLRPDAGLLPSPEDVYDDTDAAVAAGGEGDADFVSPSRPRHERQQQAVADKLGVLPAKRRLDLAEDVAGGQAVAAADAEAGPSSAAGEDAKQVWCESSPSKCMGFGYRVEGSSPFRCTLRFVCGCL